MTSSARLVALVLAGASLTVGAARAAGAEACVRPTDPGGYEGYAYGDVTAEHHDGASVRVWYALGGKHAVRADSTRTDRVPDDVALVADVAEDALSRYLALGFRAPLADDVQGCTSHGGDARLDVYLVNFANADGANIAERCDGAACTSFVLTASRLDTRYGTAGEGVRTVVPHELFHAVQNAYDAEMDRYWAEGTAQWAAETLEPSLTDLERNLPAFFAEEGRSIDVPPSGVIAGYLYGAGIWPLFLSIRHGNAVMPDVLEEQGRSGASALDAVGAALESRDDTLPAAWHRFWEWNTATGDRASSDVGYPDAATYPELEVRALGGTVEAVTSGTMAHVYRLAAPAGVRLAASTGVHTASVLPVKDGAVDLDGALPLSDVATDVDGDAYVVVTSATPSKADAAYRLELDDPRVDPASGGGCVVAVHPPPPKAVIATSLASLGGALAFRLFRRRRRAL